MTVLTEKLNDLLVICRDGKDFYEYAARQTGDAALQNLFLEMARIRQGVIEDLAARTREAGGTPRRGIGTLPGLMRRSYARLKVMVSADSDAALIAELEETEDRTLEAFSAAQEELGEGGVGLLVRRHKDTFQRTHDRMRTLKKAAA